MPERTGKALRRTGDVWREPSPGLASNSHLRVHPNEKPLRLMSRLLFPLPEASCVLDPFMGSGTTGVAAIQTGRRFVGIEIDEGYFETAYRRIADAAPLFTQTKADA
ncbi:MAG: site-specific DNA-methyltransferase [Phycisphaerae bacterium]